MKRNLAVGIPFAILGAAVILLFIRLSSVSDNAGRMETTLGQLRDSLTSARRSLDSLRAQTPGLGEYMSTIQLHIAKLWFAAASSNWKLAKYELDELGETVEAAEGLHARRDSVDVSSVLQSVRQSQLPLLDESIAKGNFHAFSNAYNQTLAACNGCHRPAGYEFIHIIPPTRETVTNEEWKPGKR